MSEKNTKLNTEPPLYDILLKELQEADNRLRAIFDSIPFPCYFRDRTHNILDCNQGCPDFFGLKSKQEYIDNFFDLSPKFQLCGKESIKKSEEMTLEAFKIGRVCFEWLHIHKNGEFIPAEVTLVRVHWQNDTYVLATLRDLRETYKLREAEQIIKERLQLMLDSSPMACVIYDENFTILEVNREALRLFELKNKQEYIDRFFELSPEYQPDGRLSVEKIKELIEASFENGRMNFGWLHQTLGGKLIHCEKTFEPVTLEGRKMIISYTRDLREINNALEMVDYLKKLAYMDPLTGAYNRRYFMEEADKALHATIEAGQELSLIMVDIDFFKVVNDTYGHDIGDEVLKILVKRMQRVLHNILIARYGGEEFVILLPNISNKNAIDIAWRVQKNITSTKFSVSGGIKIPITASFGVSSLIEIDGILSLSDILKNADKALYQAKASGRNTVVSGCC
ncbi:MAG: sensor domain-containing diguanylate cyclase [Defluviitaleaceae bacterium]|nr:sensor domain-containing diguanylate cyclase [Defluviitaleaceae bacterium]